MHDSAFRTNGTSAILTKAFLPQNLDEVGMRTPGVEEQRKFVLLCQS